MSHECLSRFYSSVAIADQQESAPHHNHVEQYFYDAAHWEGGLWTHTKNGLKYFDSVTAGRIDYSHNQVLVKLFSHALLSTSKGHEAALLKLKEDIEEQKRNSKLG